MLQRRHSLGHQAGHGIEFICLLHLVVEAVLNRGILVLQRCQTEFCNTEMIHSRVLQVQLPNQNSTDRGREDILQPSAYRHLFILFNKQPYLEVELMRAGSCSGPGVGNVQPSGCIRPMKLFGLALPRHPQAGFEIQ